MSWVKECGIDIGCETCLVTGIENDRLTRELNEGEELAVELAFEALPPDCRKGVQKP